MSTIWVTGARGFLGRQIARFFADREFLVAGLDLVDWPADDRARWGIRPWVKGPVGKDALDAIKEKAGLPQLVFHAAGSGSVGWSFTNPLDDFNSNVNTVALVLDYLRLHAPRAHFILPSSAAVYGVQPPGPIREEAIPNPVSPYGIHKSMAESLCRSAVEHFGLSCSIVRFFSLYGPQLRKQLLWDLGRRAVPKPEVIELFGTGEETRDMLYVEDAARLVYLLGEKAGRGLTLVNGGTGVAHSVRQIAGLFLDLLGCQARLTFNGIERSGDPRHYQADISLVRNMGFEPRWSLDDGLAAYADWLNASRDDSREKTGRAKDGGATR